MPKIRWAGIIKSTAEYQSGVLPAHARKLDMPATAGELQRRAIPFLLPPMGIIVLSMLGKTLLAGQRVVEPLYVVLGALLGFFVGLPLHEWLHAVAYPREATVYIGIMPRELAAVALASYPLRRSRFILMSLLPMVLGLLPLLGFLLSPATSRASNGLLFGLMIMGLTSPYPDYFNVYQVLRQTGKGCSLQCEKDDLYGIEDGGGE